MTVKRTTIELDEALASRALDATGGTLRATVERGLRLVIEQSDDEERRRQDALDRHLSSAPASVDVGVLLPGDAWR
ncbi:DUF2191 domain-containing protein [Agilicoccus flavus]|uniref:DUF2191 domain-containing protein n=1 Tax=Agilicoccus flavus TaxID=2775968 RepID=UPI001CF616C9|nr:DUF2191 domain-containing protein [Agilicoccus flavus]